MPLRRRTYGRRRSFKSRPYRKRTYSRRRSRVGAGRAKALSQRRYAGRIERALKVEYKVGDVSYSTSAWVSDTGGDIYPFINDMAFTTGTAARDRVLANQICIKGLHIGLTFSSGTNATAAVPITIALVRSRNSLVAANVDPVENDVFDMGNITSLPPSLMVRRTAAGAGYGLAAATSGAGAFGNHKVIWLKRLVVPLTTQVGGASPKTMLLKKTFKTNIRCVFNAQDYARNSVEYTLMGWSDIANVSSTAAPQVYVYARMVYTDI